MGPNPMKPTKPQVATAARELAMECADECAPPLIAHMLEYHGRYCVAGLLSFRLYDGDIFSLIQDFDSPALDVVIDANNTASDADRNGAVIFPLLYWADELDAESEQPAAQPPSSASASLAGHEQDKEET